jgi:hypothetical protein
VYYVCTICVNFACVSVIFCLQLGHAVCIYVFESLTLFGFTGHACLLRLYSLLIGGFAIRDRSGQRWGGRGSSLPYRFGSYSMAGSLRILFHGRSSLPAASDPIPWSLTVDFLNLKLVRCPCVATTYKIFNKILVSNNYRKTSTTYIIDLNVSQFHWQQPI